MIDWHCHVLPEMDDGSASVAESISLINMQASQGVDTVIATPHFYANDESMESFLERRAASLEKLRAELPADSPKIIPGAEVRYYNGISRMEGLKSLRIEGTKLLLLEMPVSTWTESMVREIVELGTKGSTRTVLAHVERYMKLQKGNVWDRLFDSDILMQVNASFFTSFFTKRKALSLLRAGDIQFIGSDCHSVNGRPPRIGDAFDVIRAKLGEDYISQMNGYGKSLLVSMKK